MVRIKEGFKGERMLSLPNNILNEYKFHPLIAPLYIRKIGFFPKVKYHYVEKPDGVEYYMLIYCIEGKGWFILDGKEKQELHPNQYTILPANTPYIFGADPETPWTIYWGHFQGKLASQFATRPGIPYPVLPGDTSRIQDRITLFEEIYCDFSMAYTKEYMIQASMCLYPFLSSFTHIEQYRYYKQKRREEETFSVQVIHYMQENLSLNMNLEQLASHFKYSSSHFSALFQKETGISPISYYIQLKIQKACQYIELTDMKLFEIADFLGFKEPAYFTRIFTKTMGMTPSEYKDKEKAKNRNAFKP